MAIPIYADDILIKTADPKNLLKTNNVLNVRFKMTNMGIVPLFLLINVVHKEEVIHVTQILYINK